MASVQQRIYFVGDVRGNTYGQYTDEAGHFVAVSTAAHEECIDEITRAMLMFSSNPGSVLATNPQLSPNCVHCGKPLVKSSPPH